MAMQMKGRGSCLFRSDNAAPLVLDRACSAKRRIERIA
jgi:hypothetical protein